MNKFLNKKNSNANVIKKPRFKHNRRVIANFAIAFMLVSLSLITFTSMGITSAFSKGGNSPIYKGNSIDNSVGIMINVYWGSEYIEPILAELKKFDAKCTFFVGGQWVNGNISLLKKIVADGHEIGNHGFFHKDHKKLNENKNREEIANCHNIVKSAIGIDMNLFAPPSGAFNDSTLAVAKELGYRTIMWSKDTIDWRDKDADVVFNRATKSVVAGDLILAHPTAHTLAALPRILQHYKTLGLKACTVTNVL